MTLCWQRWEGSVWQQDNQLLTFSKIDYNAKLRIFMLSSLASERSRLFGSVGEECQCRHRPHLPAITEDLQLV